MFEQKDRTIKTKASKVCVFSMYIHIVHVHPIPAHYFTHQALPLFLCVCGKNWERPGKKAIHCTQAINDSKSKERASMHVSSFASEFSLVIS